MVRGDGLSSLPSLKALFDRCVPAQAGSRWREGGRVLSAALPMKRYSARRAGGYYLPKIDENPGRGGQSHCKGARRTRELIQRIYHATDPVDLVAGCLDAVENRFEGSMSNYEKICGFDTSCLNAATQIPIQNTIWRIARKKLRYGLTTST
jgi:hypothetical protein